VSLDDILEAAGDYSARYGNDQGNINQSLLDDVFGTNNKDYDVDVGNPAVSTDDKYNNCSYYEEEGYGYECVPYCNCKDGEIITDGGGLIDIRSGLLDPLSSKCPSYLEVCCRHPDYIDDPEPTSPPVTKRPPPIVTEPPIAPNPCPGQSCPYRQQCGRRNIGGIGVRIQNTDRLDGSTQFGEWPHMCAVLNKKNVGGREVNLYVCGASLIAPGVALTGAHCVR
jgi:hypothetical protein